jgi:hypothetical protein
LLLLSSLLPQIIIAAGCWILLKVFTFLFGRDFPSISPLQPQEVAVASAVAFACANSINAGGYSATLLALQPAASLGLRGSYLGSLAANLHVVRFGYQVVYLLLVTIGGALLMVCYRKALLGCRHMTFPTGAAAGVLISTLHTPETSYHGAKQVS